MILSSFLLFVEDANCSLLFLNVFGHFQFCLVVRKCFSLSEGCSWLLRGPFKLVTLLSSFRFNCLRFFLGCSSCKRRFCFCGSFCCRNKI